MNKNEYLKELVKRSDEIHTVLGSASAIAQESSEVDHTAGNEILENIGMALNNIDSLIKYVSAVDEILANETEDTLEMIFRMQGEFDGRVQSDFDLLKSKAKKGYLKVPTVGMHVDVRQNADWYNFDWVKVLSFCLMGECMEIIDAIGWKHWKKLKNVREFDDATIKHIREEIADAWHFIVSLTKRAGMTAMDVKAEYLRKWGINQKRQDDGY